MTNKSEVGSEESAEGSARKNERKKRIKKEKKMNQFKTPLRSNTREPNSASTELHRK